MTPTPPSTNPTARRRDLERLAALPPGVAGRPERLRLLRALSPITEDDHHTLAELRARGGGRAGR